MLVQAIAARLIRASCRFASVKWRGNLKDVISSTMARLQNPQLPFLVFLFRFYSGIGFNIFLVASPGFSQDSSRGGDIVDSRACCHRVL
jgi:hypothetical protein